MNNKKLTLIFNNFNQEHFGKDVFLVPYYLGKEKNLDVSIIYPQTDKNKDLSKNVRGVTLIPVKSSSRSQVNPISKELFSFIYLLKNANKIDYLMRFHFSMATSLMIILYKILNPSGKTYIKTDTNISLINQLKKDINNKNIISYLKKHIYRLSLKRTDLLSCETQECLEILQKGIFGINIKDKLVLMPNGFDEELIHRFNINTKKFQEKENIIITVGRLGSEQKNTEMLLDSLKDIDLKNWKLYLIGPIDENFKKKITDFYSNNIDKKKSVLFLGCIYDKKLLWEYYNRSKVFILTSRQEGYPIVLTEAKRFKNFILSTDVSGALDIIENKKYGIIIEQENRNKLSNVINEIISEDLNIDVYKNNFDINTLSWKNIINRINL